MCVHARERENEETLAGVVERGGDRARRNMSARVLNPAMMTEISRNLGGGGDGGGGGGGGRAVPSRAALARVRRDLFGPVDHEAARALAERELRAQSLLDAERWGFDFHLEVPRANSRYEWELVTEHDVVPEPYALRGMPYLRKHAPGTPPRHDDNDDDDDVVDDDENTSSVTTTTTTATAATSTSKTMTATTTITTSLTATAATRIIEQIEPTDAAPTAERTPPQEPRVPEIGDPTTPASKVLDANAKRKRCTMEATTTPILPSAARKQTAITGEYRHPSLCVPLIAWKVETRLFVTGIIRSRGDALPRTTRRVRSSIRPSRSSMLVYVCRGSRQSRYRDGISDKSPRGMRAQSSSFSLFPPSIT